MPSSLPSFRLPLGLKCYNIRLSNMKWRTILQTVIFNVASRFTCHSSNCPSTCDLFVRVPVNQFSTDEKGSRIYTPPQSISIPLDVFMSTFAQNLPLHILCLRSCIYLHIYTLVNLRQNLGTRHQEKSRKIPWMSGVRKWCSCWNARPVTVKAFFGQFHTSSKLDKSWLSVFADRNVVAASRLLGAAAACAILLSFAAGLRKSYWSGCIKGATVISNSAGNWLMKA